MATSDPFRILEELAVGVEVLSPGSFSRARSPWESGSSLEVPREVHEDDLLIAYSEHPGLQDFRTLVVLEIFVIDPRRETPLKISRSDPFVKF